MNYNYAHTNTHTQTHTHTHIHGERTHVPTNQVYNFYLAWRTY